MAFRENCPDGERLESPKDWPPKNSKRKKNDKIIYFLKLNQWPEIKGLILNSLGILTFEMFRGNYQINKEISQTKLF